MKSNYKLLFISLLMLCTFFLLGPNLLLAQDNNPSLPETINWLKEKSDHVHGVHARLSRGDDGKYEIPEADLWETVNPSGCTLVLRNKVSDEGDYPKMSITFSLSAVNPTAIDLRGDLLYLHTTDERKAIDWHIVSQHQVYDQGGIFRNPKMKQKVRTDSFSTNNLRFEIKDEEMAQRIAKAIKHAVILCGGKKDRKEPF